MDNQLWRPIAGYTLYDHKTNDSVRRELQTECILDKIDEHRRNWLLHLQRMPLNQIPLKSYHYRPQGRKTIGRPKKRWREQLQLWRWNGSKGPILDVVDDDDDYDDEFKRFFFVMYKQ
jgi:CRISPR/Cas system CSM-associated protein Csm2 small subunit